MRENKYLLFKLPRLWGYVMEPEWTKTVMLEIQNTYRLWILPSKIPYHRFNMLTRFVVACCVAQLCPTFCDPINSSTSGFPVLHNLLELAQTCVLWVGDTIQPSHPLSPPSLAFNLSQHQGLFQLVCFSHYVAKLLELQHHWEYSGLISFRIDWFDLKGSWRVLSNTAVRKHHFFGRSSLFMAQLSHLYMTTGKTIAWLDGPCWQSNVSAF